MATQVHGKNSREINPPSPLLALTEIGRAVVELGTLPLAAPLLMTAPRGDGHPVLVLPGFVTTDLSTSVLRRFLKRQGYDAHAWKLGRNLGPRAIGWEGEKLIARLEAIHEATGKKVSLVGWSLGGILARQLSRRRPDLVRQVISLGSPFTGDPRATNVWKAYEFLTGQRLKDPRHARAARGERTCAAGPFDRDLLERRRRRRLAELPRTGDSNDRQYRGQRQPLWPRRQCCGALCCS